ncbi:hypothetical protein CVT26_011729, partial [Gymnopilus dilepis]
MDNPGWHAQRRAQKENEAYNREYRASGAHHPPGEDVMPMDESFIGGFRHPPPPPSPRPPAVPPKDLPPHLYSARPSQSTISTAQLTQMSAVERSHVLRVARMDPHLQFMCGPLLKYDTIDEHGIWHGAALIITLTPRAAADSGSIYEPHPTLTYTWDPERPAYHPYSNSPASSPTSPTYSPTDTRFSTSNGNEDPPRPSGLTQLHTAKSYELGPHPADPHSTVLAASPSMGVGTFGFHPGLPIPNTNPATNGTNGNGNGNGHGLPDDSSESENLCSERVPGQEIWAYGGYGGTFTFWRFLIKVPLAQHEMPVRYSINRGQQLEFWVPGRNQNMRWAAHSCNGFSAGVNPDDFRGPGFKSGYDPVWMDLLSKHAELPFHALVGGGDQLYCDSIMREPELQEWVSLSKPEEKKAYRLTPEIELAIDRFYFNHYCQMFRSGAFARANCSILTALEAIQTTCREHRFSSSASPLLTSPNTEEPDIHDLAISSRIGARGYFYFLLFQCFINVEIDGISDAPGKHVYQSVVIGEMGPYVRLRSHSFLPRLGPRVYMLLLD